MPDENVNLRSTELSPHKLKALLSTGCPQKRFLEQILQIYGTEGCELDYNKPNILVFIITKI